MVRIMNEMGPPTENNKRQKITKKVVIVSQQ